MPSSGITTAPMQVDYHDVLRVWREADTLPEIEHAWLFDPASITRSIHLQVSYDDPGSVRKAIAEAASLLTLTHCPTASGDPAFGGHPGSEGL